VWNVVPAKASRPSISGRARSLNMPSALTTTSAAWVPPSPRRSVHSDFASFQRAPTTSVRKRQAGSTPWRSATPAEIGEDLGLRRVRARPARVDVEGERVELALDVAGTAGVAVVVPGAADLARLLEEDEILEARLLEPMAMHSPPGPAPMIAMRRGRRVVMGVDSTALYSSSIAIYHGFRGPSPPPPRRTAMLETIDADGHVQEPTDAIAERLPAGMRDFAPRSTIDASGRIRQIVGGEWMPYIPVPDSGTWEIPEGGHDPKRRLADMDRQRIARSISFRLSA
jgi:hypothetical protein